MTPIHTQWTKREHCKSCNVFLNDRERYYSGGVCPHCGAISDSHRCDTVPLAARWVITYQPPWWKFWKDSEGHWEYKDDQL